jgi:alpha-glucosidase
MQTLVQSTKEKPGDTLFVHVFNGNEKNLFVYYEDAGEGFEYKKGVYAKRDIEFDPGKKQLTFSRQEGSFNSVFKKVEIVFHGFGKELKSLTVNGAKKEVKDYGTPILDPLANLEDYYDKSLLQSLRNADIPEHRSSIVVDNQEKEFSINWER